MNYELWKEEQAQKELEKSYQDYLKWENEISPELEDERTRGYPLHD